jgi:hypothetical protein
MLLKPGLAHERPDLAHHVQGRVRRTAEATLVALPPLVVLHPHGVERCAALEVGESSEGVEVWPPVAYLQLGALVWAHAADGGHHTSQAIAPLVQEQHTNGATRSRAPASRMLREGEAEEPHHCFPANGEDNPPRLALKPHQGFHEAPMLTAGGDWRDQAEQLVAALDRRHEALEDGEGATHAQGIPQERVENVLRHREDLA